MRLLILSLLLVATVVMTSGCSSAPRHRTAPPATSSTARAAKPKPQGNILFQAWKTVNPLYRSDWSPWQKFVYWAGPGH